MESFTDWNDLPLGRILIIISSYLKGDLFTPQHLINCDMFQLNSDTGKQKLLIYPASYKTCNML